MRLDVVPVHFNGSESPRAALPPAASAFEIAFPQAVPTWSTVHVLRGTGTATTEHAIPAVTAVRNRKRWLNTHPAWRNDKRHG